MRVIISGLFMVAVVDYCLIEIIRFFHIRRQMNEQIRRLDEEIKRKWKQP